MMHSVHTCDYVPRQMTFAQPSCKHMLFYFWVQKPSLHTSVLWQFARCARASLHLIVTKAGMMKFCPLCTYSMALAHETTWACAVLCCGPPYGALPTPFLRLYSWFGHSGEMNIPVSKVCRPQPCCTPYTLCLQTACPHCPQLRKAWLLGTLGRVSTPALASGWTYQGMPTMPMSLLVSHMEGTLIP